MTEFALDDLHPNLNNNQEITKILLRKEVSLKIKKTLENKKKKLENLRLWGDTLE